MIDNTVGASRDPVREKLATVLPRNLFPTDVCAYVAWISPGVVLLASITRLGKSVMMLFNFGPAGLSERMTS